MVSLVSVFLKGDAFVVSRWPQIEFLSAKFSQDYPSGKCPEILYKPDRPYSCLLISTHAGYYICVPFRSSINHGNAFFFKQSSRSRRTSSGLDYSKIVIINNTDYFDPAANARVDQDEYNEMKANIARIEREAAAYVSAYVDHITGTKVLHPREYQRKYGYTTLVYFHDILGIQS